MKVYLAGPVTGLSWDEATTWRTKATRELKQWGIHCYSPLRDKPHLKNSKAIGAFDDAPTTGGHYTDISRYITARNRHDCLTADIVLMNLLKAKRISIGTMIEVGWADAGEIPLILVMNRDNIHNHPMVIDPAAAIVDSIEDGIELVRSYLIP